MDVLDEKTDSCFDVVVVGACFCDLLTYVAGVPAPGETKYAKKFLFDFGGKGANMCIMAAKLGSRTAMVSIVGDDIFGRETVGNFKKFGVNAGCVYVTGEASTGITQCIVDDSGEPSFICNFGASKLLLADHVFRAENIIRKGKVLLTNKGIPLPTAQAALQLGKSLGLMTIFNPSPKLSELDEEVYTNTDVLVLNMEEAACLTKTGVKSIGDAYSACAWFHNRGTQHVVITLGQGGAVGSMKDVQCDTQAARSSETIFHIPARMVDVVDTTGAGDALAGALAFFTSSYPQLSFKEVVTRSVAIATVTVQTEGVQKSYPSRECLPDELFS